MQTICPFIWSQSIDETVLHPSHAEADATVLDENELEALVNHLFFFQLYLLFIFSFFFFFC